MVVLPATFRLLVLRRLVGDRLQFHPSDDHASGSHPKARPLTQTKDVRFGSRADVRPTPDNRP
jgi:hypothetical protein